MTTQPDRGHGLTVGAVVADTYQVTRLLGRGGMGSVWEASHLRLPGKRVAIKVLHADIAADHEALARFRREAEIATRLGHPNIVEVHDFNTLPDGKPYLVLELLVGESLDSRLRRAPVSVDDAMRIAAQIGAALAAAHREQVVHRDLKPQNVFLVRPRDDGEGGEVVKVLDFGISKIRGSQTVKTLETTLLGTPQYMSPEQATGNHAAVDQRTDVFALGAIVYEMLVGRPAFTGQSIPEVVFKVVYEQPVPLAELVPGLPARVADAVERALSKAQDDRYPDVVTFVEEMAGVSLSTLRRSPISLAPPAPTQATGMESTIAAPSTDRSRAPGGQTGDGGAPDPLARTVDSGRRELAPLPPAPSPPPRSIPPGLHEGRTESMRAPQVLPPRGPTHPGPAEPMPRDSSGARTDAPIPRDSTGARTDAPIPRDSTGAPLAEPMLRAPMAEVPTRPRAAVRRRGRHLALLLASLTLVGAGAATALLMTRSSESGERRAGAAGRGERARSARRTASAAERRGGEPGQRDGRKTDPRAEASATTEPGAAPDEPGAAGASAEASAAEPSGPRAGEAGTPTPGSTIAGEAANPTPGAAAGDAANPASGSITAGEAARAALAPTPSTGADATAASPSSSSAGGHAAASADSARPEAGDARVSELRPSPPRRPRTPARATDGGDDPGQPSGAGQLRGEIGAALAAGEQAIRGGDFRQAVVLAERALRHGGGPAAHALHARASCGLGDLGNAKASFLRIPTRNRALRRVVAAACSRAGIDVGP
jgi:serine/threonine-protein kinase